MAADPDPAIAAAQADLVAWDLLEESPPLRLTRRARAALARAAAALREEEVAGRAPAGHPLVNAAARALDEVAPAGRAGPVHVRLVAAVELASLPEAVQGLLRQG